MRGGRLISKRLALRNCSSYNGVLIRIPITAGLNTFGTRGFIVTLQASLLSSKASEGWLIAANSDGEEHNPSLAMFSSEYRPSGERVVGRMSFLCPEAMTRNQNDFPSTLNHTKQSRMCGWFLCMRSYSCPEQPCNTSPRSLVNPQAT